MAKKQADGFRKLEGFQVQKNGVDYKLIVSEHGIIAIEECVPYKEAAPTVFYWDWLEVAEKLTQRPEASAHIPQPTLEQEQERAKRQREGDKATSRLPTDPASRRSIPGTGAEPEKAIDPASQRSIPGTGAIEPEKKPDADPSK